MKPINILNNLKEGYYDSSNSKKLWSDNDLELVLTRLDLSPSDAMGGIIRFEDIDINALIDLFEAGYANPSDRQNEGPSIQEIIDFYHYHSTPEEEVRNFTVEGYVVLPPRRDYRISVDGVEFDFDEEALDDVNDFIKSADEKSCKNNHASAWWD